MNDPDAAYDPDPLTVGDRVTIRISGESDHFGAIPNLDGVTGTVVGVNDRAPLYPGHPYLVHPDLPGAPSWAYAYLARIELHRYHHTLRGTGS